MKKKIILSAMLGLLILALLAGGLLHFWPRSAPNETPNLSIRMGEDGILRIAQFADLHFGDGKSQYHNTREERTRAYMAYVVETEQPDLIVCSGDQLMGASVSKIKEFIALMDSFQTLWTFVWGNHDTESKVPGYTKRELSAVLSASDSPYLLYADGYTEGGKENRYGNFSIQVLDAAGERLLGALTILDTGTFDYDENRYQQITQGQISWYRREIDRLQGLYDGAATVPTVLFAHMPLPDFSVAHRKATAGQGAEFVIEDGRTWGSGDLDAPHSPLFAAMVEKGSTKACFVGHYHISKYQVRMDGILLGFGPQMGFSHTGYDGQRSIYIYSIAEDFSITTHSCPEQMAQ